jgi:SHS2 domain-containing protein
MEQGYEEIEHTADWSLRVKGQDLGELFRNAAFGMAGLMGISTENGPLHIYRLELKAEDPEALLVAFLEEILYRVEFTAESVEDINFSSISTNALSAAITYLPVVEVEKAIKAVTFHLLEILESERGFETVIVFDV